MGPRVGIGGSRALPYHKVSSPLLWRRFRVAYQIIESLAISLWYAMHSGIRLRVFLGPVPPFGCRDL